jgi:hypothetical protein
MPGTFFSAHPVPHEQPGVICRFQCPPKVLGVHNVEVERLPARQLKAFDPERPARYGQQQFEAFVIHDPFLI